MGSGVRVLGSTVANTSTAGVGFVATGITAAGFGSRLLFNNLASSFAALSAENSRSNA